MLALMAIIFAASVAFAVMPEGGIYFYGFSILVLVVVILDAVFLLLEPLLVVRRRVPQVLPLWAESEVSLRVESRATHTQFFTLFDHLPAHFNTQQLPVELQVNSKGYTEYVYRVRATERGDHTFAQTEIRVKSQLKLWCRRMLVGECTQVKVYPNFSTLARYALLATDHRLSQIGVLKRRRRGLGSDFQQLREYREGDTQRQIDWKASSRMGKLISRQYQDERDQQIVLLIDCGRRMSNRDGELTHMDHVLNASLLLAYVGLRQGDAVGLFTMAGEQHWLAPRKSIGTINVLLNEVYDIQPSPHSPDFYAASVELMRRLRKRALVVVVSNLRDEDDNTLQPAVRLLQQRHLVMVASLREPVLTQTLAQPVLNLSTALTHAAVADYLELRYLAFRRLEQQRVPCVDVEPSQLALALVNRYIDIKRSGRM